MSRTNKRMTSDINQDEDREGQVFFSPLYFSLLCDDAAFHIKTQHKQHLERFTSQMASPLQISSTSATSKSRVH